MRAVTRAGGRVAAVLLACAAAACSEGEGGGSPAAAASPARLQVTVPAPSAIVPRCATAGLFLVRDGADLGCGSVCPTGGATCSIVCIEDRGLMSATPYDLAVEYVHRGAVVARGPLAPGLELSPGDNAVALVASGVALTDSNGDGVADAEAMCP